MLVGNIDNYLRVTQTRGMTPQPSVKRRYIDQVMVASAICRAVA